MKTLIALVCLALAPLVGPGCATTPTAVVTPVEATTLRAAALAAQATMSTTAQLLKAGEITVAQWERLAAFHDKTYQPAYNLALKAAMSELAIASPDLLALLGQLAALAASFKH